jgi:DNA modification methylase
VTKKTAEPAEPPKPRAAQFTPEQIELVPLELLIPYARNSRTHTDEQVAEIAASMKEFGWTNPCLIRSAGGKLSGLVAGHARVLAARKLGRTHAPCIRLDHLTEAQAKAYVIADNRLAEKAKWDDAMLALEFDDLLGEGFALELTGFNLEEQQEVRKRLAEASSAEDAGQPGEDDFGTVPVDPITRAGDVWHIGKHRLGCLDVFDGDALAALIGTQQPNVIATDPPYAIYGSSTGQASDIADDVMVRPFFEGVLRLVRDRLPWFGHAYVFCDWRSYPTLALTRKRVETVELRNLLVWDKGGSGLGSNYANSHELIAFFAKLPQQTAMGHRHAGVRTVHKPNVLRHNRPTGKDREHNAAKPVALMRDLIENSTGPGDVVLEPFCGSGSTMVAADQIGRVCIAADIEPKWCDVTIGRLARLREIEARLGGPAGPTYREIASQREGDTPARPPRNKRH